MKEDNSKITKDILTFSLENLNFSPKRHSITKIKYMFHI